MIRHLLKICWNRKRAHALVVVEVFFSFLVVFAVMTIAVYNLDNYRRPLGFDYQDVLNLTVASYLSGSPFVGPSDPSVAESRRLLEEVRSLPSVESAAGMSLPLFDLSLRSDDLEYRGRRLDVSMNEVTDDFAQVMRIGVTRGRWFEPADDALGYQPIVINQRLQRDLFGDEDPIGKRVSPSDRPGTREQRVVGVIEDFREDGELSGPETYFFARLKTTGSDAAPLINLVVRLRPGTAVAYEETVVNRLRSLAPGRTFQAAPLSQLRRSILKLKLLPMAALGIVAVFMLIMVGLGMVGVLWQSVARRRREIGLRRAVGATATAVSVQVLSELLVVTTAGFLLGAALALQMPLLGVFGWVSGAVYASALALSILVIYALTVIAALYPSWLATLVHPAEALHYE